MKSLLDKFYFKNYDMELFIIKLNSTFEYYLFIFSLKNKDTLSSLID